MPKQEHTCRTEQNPGVILLLSVLFFIKIVTVDVSVSSGSRDLQSLG